MIHEPSALSIYDYMATLILKGWELSHLIRLPGEDWQVNLRSEDSVVVATGDSITAAMLSALQKTDDPTTWRPKFTMLEHRAPDAPTLKQILGTERRLEGFRREF